MTKPLVHSKTVSMQLGRILRVLRTSKGMTQEELAEKTGLHRTYIGVVERGEKNITIINCMKIAHVLGCDLACILKEVETVLHPSLHSSKETPIMFSEQNC